MKRFVFLASLASLLASAVSCDVPSQPASVNFSLEIFHGDLLFCVEEPSGDGLSDAIANVTEGIDGSQVVHVGIACQQNGRMMVLEATPSHGVWLTPIDKFFEEAEYDETKFAIMINGYPWMAMKERRGKSYKKFKRAVRTATKIAKETLDF